jgi:hypothetical protein
MDIITKAFNKIDISFDRDSYLAEAKVVINNLVLHKNLVFAALVGHSFVDKCIESNCYENIINDSELRWYFREINKISGKIIELFTPEEYRFYIDNLPDKIMDPDYIMKNPFLGKYNSL